MIYTVWNGPQSVLLYMKCSFYCSLVNYMLTWFLLLNNLNRFTVYSSTFYLFHAHLCQRCLLVLIAAHIRWGYTLAGSKYIKDICTMPSHTHLGAIYSLQWMNVGRKPENPKKTDFDMRKISPQQYQVGGHKQWHSYCTETLLTSPLQHSPI